MAHESSGRIIAGAMTSLGLGLVWLVVAGNFPSPEEFSTLPLSETVRLSAGSSPSVAAPPPLDLTIPGSASVPSALSAPQRENVRLHEAAPDTSSAAQHVRDVQSATAQCDAEIAHVCPDSQKGVAQARCLDQRMLQLSVPCRSQVRERLVKWKDTHRSVLVACEAEVKRFCRGGKGGDGPVLQCLQSHAPEVSTRCYRTLPKGTVYFK